MTSHLMDCGIGGEKILPVMLVLCTEVNGGKKTTGFYLKQRQNMQIVIKVRSLCFSLRMFIDHFGL